MAAKKLITVTEFCRYHQLNSTFIYELHSLELIKLEVVKRTRFIPNSELYTLEKMIRLSNDLDIAPTNMHAIFHLLKQLNDKDEELKLLRNKVKFYEQ